MEDFRTVDGSAGARRSGTRRIEGLHTEIASGNHGTGGCLFWTIGTHLADRLRAHFNQTLNLQRDAVRAEGCEAIFEDTASSAGRAPCPPGGCQVALP